MINSKQINLGQINGLGLPDGVLPSVGYWQDNLIWYDSENWLDGLSGEGDLCAITQAVMRTEPAGNFLPVTQTVAVIGSGNINAITQTVELLKTGSGELVPITQTINATASGELVPITQRVLSSAYVYQFRNQ